MSSETTWKSLLLLDPRLADLERLALNSHRYGFCEARDWQVIVGQLRRRVSWDAKLPELGTSEAYDVAYRHLLGCWEGGR